MDKKYIDFMDEISDDALYEGLLAYGFFTEKLPPVFTAFPFFEYCKGLETSFSQGWNEYISFRVMRNIGTPRIMGIPNPFKYQLLCLELKSNWAKIKKHFQTQTANQNHRISRIHIRKESGKRRIFEMNYKDWRTDGNPELDLLFHEDGASRYLVKADISTCFPSIYSHSIPWALVGKETAKKNHKDSSAWYNKIDSACSDMHHGETHGILIGPHSSNLLSEIILTVVDRKLYEKGYRYVRAIDDYDCYVKSYKEAQCFIVELEEALYEFDLHLNHKKTKVVELPIGVDKTWKHTLKGLIGDSDSGSLNYTQVNTFIDTALKLAVESGDYAIVNYAIKTLKGLNKSENGKLLITKRVMHLAILYPYLLPLMEEFVFEPYKVDKEEIKKFSDMIYQDAVKINDYESLCYAIYFSIKFDFILNEFENDYQKSQEYVIDSKNCLLLIMTWIYFMRQNGWNRKATQVKPLNKVAMELKNTDMDRYWLFCYEALTWGSLSNEWRLMKKAGVSFIDSSIKTKYDIG